MVGRRTQQRAVDWATRLAATIAPAEAARIATRMISTIDDVSANRWDAAVERARALPGTIRPEKVQALTDQFARELGAAGAAAGVAAAAPAGGTMATLAATPAELAWFTARAGDLILTMAALHGHPNPSVDERRAWVLAVLIYGGSARDGLAVPERGQRATAGAHAGARQSGQRKRVRALRQPRHSRPP